MPALQQQLDVVETRVVVIGVLEHGLVQGFVNGGWVVLGRRVVHCHACYLGFQHVAFGQIFIQESFELSFGHGAHETIDRFAVNQQNTGRDAADAKCLAQLLLLVGVDLDQLETACVVFLDLFQQGANHLTWAAPRGPKVDQYGRGGGSLDDLGFKVFCGNVDHAVHFRTKGSGEGD